MRLLVCAIVAGCGGLDIYEPPAAVPDDTSGPVEPDPVPWVPGDDPEPWPVAPIPEHGPLFRLGLSEGSSAVPELDAQLTGRDDLVVQLDRLDPPRFEAHLGAIAPHGAQDFCVPTVRQPGSFDGTRIRFVIDASAFDASALPWQRLSVEADLVDDQLLGAVLRAELPAAAVPLDDPCQTLGCHRCAAPGQAGEDCVVLPIAVPSEPLPGFELEPLTVGDAEAHCP